MSQSPRMPINPFDKLADETIEVILWYLKGKSFDESQELQELIQCDHRFRRITLPILYRKIILSTSINVFRGLLHFIHFSYLAPLVKSISLTSDEEEDPDEKREELTDEEISIIIDAAQRLSLPTGILENVEQLADWAVILCFLPILPNLDEFIVLQFTHPTKSCDLHATNIFDSRYVSPTLRWVALYPNIWSPMSLDVESLFPLFLIPSMRKISAHRVISRLESALDAFIPLPDTGSAEEYQQSSVEVLQLHYSAISPKALDKLLRRPKALKEFFFTNGSLLGVSVPPERVQRSLDHVSKTLKTLVLEVTKLPFVIPMLSFSHFASLKTLCTTYPLLIEPDPTTVPDRLPSSLEILALWVPRIHRITYLEVVDFFRTILVSKSSTVLPHLRMFVLRGYYGKFDWGPLAALASEKRVEIGEDYLVTEL
ncbi:hypothetical protein CPB86DRAFT_791341 [Serendipita vermifera]|nr:hypothetical protein CPB86DRAFT_791341 [Serendipita vermifera]